MNRVANWITGKDDTLEPSHTLVDTVASSVPAPEAERQCNRLTGRAEIRNAVLVVPEEDVEIHGRWVGDVSRIVCHTLYVEPGSYVEGDILAQRIRVSGHIKGVIKVGYLSVIEGAMVEGTVNCRSMGVQPKSRMKATVSCDESEAIADLPTGTAEAMDVRNQPWAGRMRLVN